jgi:succinate-acetate transporter protein
MTQQDPIATPQTKPTTPFGASIADPGPLGLAGFAGTTFFLSVVNTNMLGASVQSIVFGLAFFYGGLAQLLAGMWEFTKGNTFGALAFSSYGAFWLSFWWLLTHLPKAAPPDILHGVGVYLLVWTIFTAYMTVAALRTTGAVTAVFVLLTLTFLVLTIGFFSESVTDFEKNSNAWIHIGGWLGIITAAAAWYASFAGVTNSTFKRVVFPVFPMESGAVRR